MTSDQSGEDNASTAPSESVTYLSRLSTTDTTLDPVGAVETETIQRLKERRLEQ